MADPARYDIDTVLMETNKHPDPSKVSLRADLYIERSSSGQWVKWADFKDYKAAQKRNKSEEAVERLGLECVELRVRIEDLEAEIRDLKDKLGKR